MSCFQVSLPDRAQRTTSSSGRRLSPAPPGPTLRTECSSPASPSPRTTPSIPPRWSSSPSFSIQIFILTGEFALGEWFYILFPRSLSNLSEWWQHFTPSWQWSAWLRVEQREMVSSPEYREDPPQCDVNAGKEEISRVFIIENLYYFVIYFRPSPTQSPQLTLMQQRCGGKTDKPSRRERVSQWGKVWIWSRIDVCTYFDVKRLWYKLTTSYESGENSESTVIISYSFFIFERHNTLHSFQKQN